ncbi:MAG: hypothetical protein IPP72_15750 [Chitinophagaceae bacterium]|nr:hypothetical protein [Chitinophagaceae bacterium]
MTDGGKYLAMQEDISNGLQHLYRPQSYFYMTTVIQRPQAAEYLCL